MRKKKSNRWLRELDEREEFSYDTMRAMAELGLFGMFVPEDYAGQAMDYVSYIIATEEIARVDGSHAATVAAGQFPGHRAAVLLSVRQRGAEKEIPAQAVFSEPGSVGLRPDRTRCRSDAGNTKTTAVQDGDEWVINGSKIFITNASTDITAGVTVLCQTGRRDDGRKELSCILVEAGTPGFEARPMHRR